MKILTANVTENAGGHEPRHLVCRATEPDYRPRKLIIPDRPQSGGVPVKPDPGVASSAESEKLDA